MEITTNSNPIKIPVILLNNDFCYYFETYDKFKVCQDTGILEGYSWKAPYKISENSKDKR